MTFHLRDKVRLFRDGWEVGQGEVVDVFCGSVWVRSECFPGEHITNAFRMESGEARYRMQGWRIEPL